MKINKITIILTLFLLFNCDYKPIYSTKSIVKNKNFTINSIVFSGENKINKKLQNNLTNYLNLKSKKIKYNLIIDSSSIRKISSRDKKGSPERYVIIIRFNIDFLQNDKLVSNEKFEKSYEYKNMSNKYDLKVYEENVRNNLVDNIYEDIIRYLNLL